jgi:histidyl-tRNA synthetase
MTIESRDDQGTTPKMSKLQPVRGTRDILPDENRRFRQVTETFRGVAENFGFEEIATPIFEFTEVFARTLGETSDIVSKEMYTFEDRGGDNITLRPEYTAGIARAFISGGLAQDLPLRLYGHGPMFRYERPQKGRYRQFHQMTAELLGVAEPQADIEIIAMGAELIRRLGVADAVTLEINTLGDAESRLNYRGVLVDYLKLHEAHLSEDSIRRLHLNPLRILDSKDESDREIVKNAPRMSESLTLASKDFFRQVTEGLDALGIDFIVNERLVRGLDYYCHTAFEFITASLGAQGTVLAGGRYDGLIEMMGGPPTPGIGWGSGIERLAMLIDEPPPPERPIAVVPVGDDAQVAALKIAHELRRAGLAVDMSYKGNVGRRMKRANKVNARAALILGSDELARDVVTLRDLDSGEQAEVPIAELAERLKTFR